MHHNTAYGESRQTSGSTTIYNPFLYTGQELDSETGFYHLRARHYSPGLGRFLARDPIGYVGGSNLYGYCGGDPVNAFDPNGTEVRIGFTDGSVYATSSAQDLETAIKYAPGGSIASIVVRGHGGVTGTSLTGRDAQTINESIDVFGSKVMLLGFDSKGRRTRVDLAKLLAKKFSSGGKFFINSCTTEDLAVALSKALPEILVRGVTGQLNEGKIVRQKSLVGTAGRAH